MRKRLNMRWRLALGLFLATIIGTFVMGGLLFGGLMPQGGDFWTDFWLASKTFYRWFFAGGTVAALLLLLTKIHEDYALGFGYGLYYGTAGVSVMLKEFYYMPEQDALLLGFIITALVCLVIWYAIIKPYFLCD